MVYLFIIPKNKCNVDNILKKIIYKYLLIKVFRIFAVPTKWGKGEKIINGKKTRSRKRVSSEKRRATRR
ncbi:hypothetical protein BN1088_480003 [Sphingobacterium sp. PM2-P1-29]|nr:hypothetical protein BN1088_480003 [Sphingobacterium sp. PM2-P1-29]